jgi:hypothetical protein
MHKDPPPGLLEKSTGTVVTYGVLIGFVAGIVCAGVWSFFYTVNNRGRIDPPAAAHQQR